MRVQGWVREGRSDGLKAAVPAHYVLVFGDVEAVDVEHLRQMQLLLVWGDHLWVGGWVGGGSWVGPKV